VVIFAKGRAIHKAIGQKLHKRLNVSLIHHIRPITRILQTAQRWSYSFTTFR
jgi:hypothetical protein